MAKDFTIEYNAQVKVTNEDILDIMSSAVYGIAYWVEMVRYTNERRRGDNVEEHIANGGQVVVEINEPIEEGGPIEFALDRNTVLKGVKKYLETGNQPYNILDADNGEFILDCGMVDATVADMIIQYGLFGELIFG